VQLIKTIKEWIIKFFDNAPRPAYVPRILPKYVASEVSDANHPCKIPWVSNNQDFEKPIWWGKAGYIMKGWYYNHGPQYFKKSDIHVKAWVTTLNSESLYLCPINELLDLMNRSDVVLVNASLLKHHE